MTLRDHLGVPYADGDQPVGEVVVDGRGVGFAPGRSALVPTADLETLDAMVEAGARAAIFAAGGSGER